MAIDIGKAYVQIVPSAQGISGSISKVLNGESADAGKNIGNSIAGNIAGTLKKLIPAAAIGKLIYDSVSEGAKLEQSFVGGLDTLYGEAADHMRELATQAAAAGISANDYAEQAVSFGAALKASFGDAEDAETKAAEAADKAILAMADNSAKMGTDLASIQNAYQGFAKQNYTMLDNLKLGYGGTKSEMERLLKDAEEFSGIKYDIDNLSDVYSAISAIQEKLGIAGVAAEEAKDTLSGSLNALQASFRNVLGNLALGEDVGPSLTVLVESASAFLTGNLIPTVMNVVKKLPGAIMTVIGQASPELLDGGVEMLSDLAQGFAQGFPEMAVRFVELIGKLASTIWDHRGELLEIGNNIIDGLIQGILAAAGKLFEALLETVESAFNKVKNWLGISSPSKKFAWIGEMTGEGLAEGLYGSTKLVQNAMDSMLEPVNDPVVSTGNLAFAGGSSIGSLAITFNIDNSGKDITDEDIARWGAKITDVVNENMGRMI